MSSYDIGTTTTVVEVKNAYSESIVEATVNEDLFLNKNGYEIRKAKFTGSFNADEVNENDSISSRKILSSADIVTGKEFRKGEIFSIFDASSNYKESAKVVSCEVGKVVVDLYGNEKVLSGYTFVCNADALFTSGKVIRFDSMKYGTPTFASNVASPASNNLTITRVEDTVPRR